MTSSRARAARVFVTADCAGTGQCVAVAPSVFALDADGLSTVVGPVDSPAAVTAASRAAELCPMAAIRVEPAD